ncbi:MAG: DEAD/DEAH box helicase [Desulfocapsaceae bacterium]|nr:DEAD/DEAH box helicase [Desulfocapsaceae bacterium]
MSFKDFYFHQTIQSGIKNCGYITPTPIQQQSIPHMLSGKDVLGLAQTGTGKTAAFVLPMLQRLLNGPRKRIRALIMAPTRELAQQIHYNIGEMAIKTGLRSAVVYGGVGRQPQLNALRNGTEIIVACPGRLLDLLGEKGTSLSSVELLVLDEADHMFDKGFLPDMRKIIEMIPRKRQSVIFSATMPQEIQKLTQDVLIKPVRIQIDHSKSLPNIEHTLFTVKQAGKTALLKTLLQEREMTRTLVFTRTKHKAKSLAIALQKAGIKASSMQGNLSQQKRQAALDGFQQGTFPILVATDIAARGIDVQEISHVINYDLPDTMETYTHRTGRTGRAKNSGKAFSFVSQDDSKFITNLKRKFKFIIKDIQPTSSTEKDERKSHPHKKKAARPQQLKRSAAKRQGAKKKSKAAAFDFGLRPQTANRA